MFLAVASVVIFAFILRTRMVGKVCLFIDDTVLPTLVVSSKSLLWSLIHSYGIILPLFYEFFVRILTFSGIQVNEFWWVFPSALIGTLTVLIVYFLVRKISTSGNALLVATITAALPTHIRLSRYSYGYEGMSLFLALLSLYLFILFLKDSRRITGVLLSLALSFYILSHALSFFMLVIFLWTAVVFTSKQDDKRTLWKRLRMVFGRKIFIFPLVSIVFLFLLGIIYLIGLRIESNINNLMQVACMDSTLPIMYYQLTTTIGHYILRCGMSMGRQYFDEARRTFYDHYSFWPYLTLFVVPFGVKDIYKLSVRSIFFIWAALYLIPFFAIDLFNVTRAWVYFSFGLVPLVIYICLLLYGVGVKIYQKLNKFILKVIFLGVLGYTIFITVENGYKEIPKFVYNNGIKSMGYYVRTYINKDSSLFYYIGDNDNRIHPVEFWYYFGRNAVYSKHQAKREEMEKIFRENKEKIDIIITNPANEQFFGNFPDFEIKAIVLSKTYDRQKIPLLLLYGRKKLNLPFRVLDMENYDRLFDRSLFERLRKKYFSDVSIK